MVEAKTEFPRRPKLSRVFWFALVVVMLAGLGLLFPVRSGPIIDKIYQTDAETAQIHAALRAYEVTFGAFPSGDSPAVFRALSGQNPRQIIFLQWRKAESASPDGVMLDPWGTPYKVYFSGKEPLVRSAGPNKQFDRSGDKRFDDYIR